LLLQRLQLLLLRLLCCTLRYSKRLQLLLSTRLLQCLLLCMLRCSKRQQLIHFLLLLLLLLSTRLLQSLLLLLLLLLHLNLLLHPVLLLPHYVEQHKQTQLLEIWLQVGLTCQSQQITNRSSSSWHT
jgi:hypothetical protein